MQRHVAEVLTLALLTTFTPLVVGCSPPYANARAHRAPDDDGVEPAPDDGDEGKDGQVLEPSAPTKGDPPITTGGGAPAPLPLAPGEPAYCDPAEFAKKEVTLEGATVANLHAFELGSVTLAGLGVGDSETASVVALAKRMAPAVTAAEKSCTFYYNDGNEAAQTAFNWYYVPKPSGSAYADRVAEYASVLEDVFDTKPTSFLSCAKTHHYVAMGCDGMHHRGPSVFAAALAYTGCSPEHATAIVNQAWGENGVEPRMRIEIAKWAAGIGKQHPEQSSKLRELLGGAP